MNVSRRAALATVLVAGLTAGQSSSRIAGAADAVTINLGAMPTDASAQAFYASDQGFFKANGLDVKLQVLTNTASIAAAVSSGGLDIGYGSVVPLAEAHNRGINFHMLAPASIYSGPPAQLIIAASKTSSVKSGADLNGKTVACNGLRDLTQYNIQAWIDQNGGDVKTVKLVEIPFSEMGAALAAGRVDAAIIAEPFASAAKNLIRVIGNASAAVGKHYVITGWFATDAWLQKNADVARRFASTMRQTAVWANAHQKQSADILARNSKMAPETLTTMTRSIYGESGLDPSLVQPAIDVAAKYGTLQTLPAADLIWR